MALMVAFFVAVLAAGSIVVFCMWMLKREFEKLGDVLESMQADMVTESLRHSCAEEDNQ